jgi:hypothetical protein
VHSRLSFLFQSIPLGDISLGDISLGGIPLGGIPQSYDLIPFLRNQN